ncbi:MAG: PAS domain S-box protein [Hyphomicrobium sp.]|jgi:PAS domain S-box-containing protein|nr:PAS domain S-box protein [Hyphomicrobium sp.]
MTTFTSRDGVDSDVALAELSRRTDSLHLLNEIAQDLLRAEGRSELLDRVFDRVGPHLNADVFFSYRYLPESSGKPLKLFAAGGVDGQTRETFSELALGEAVCGTTAKLRRCNVINDLQSATMVECFPLKPLGLQCYACHPLIARGRLLGTLSYGSRSQAGFSLHDQAFISALAASVALALDRLEAEADAGIATHLAQSRSRDLVETELRYRSVFDNAAVGIARVALNGAWLEVNDRLCEITGWPRDALLAIDFQAVTHQDDLDKDIDRTQQLLAGRIAYYTIDTRVVRSGGDFVWVALTVALTCGPGGAPLEFVFVVQDISERVATAEALAASERHLISAMRELGKQQSGAGAGTAFSKRFDAFLANAPLGIAVFDRLYRYIHINNILADINGIAAQEHLGRSIRELIPDHYPRVAELIDEVLATGQAFANIELSGETPKQPGVRRHWLTGFFPIGEGEDRLVGVWVTETTFERRAEDALRVVSHEAVHRSKNLISVVRAIASQTLGDRPKSVVQKLDDRLMAVAANIDLLIESNWTHVSLNDLAEKVLEPFGGGPVVRAGPDVVLTPGQGQALSMAFHELATNASKYGALSTPEGRVELSWRIVAGDIVIDWVETGGPLVGEPMRTGFGRTVTTRLLRQAVRGTVDLAFAPQGVRWSVRFPLNVLS